MNRVLLLGLGNPLLGDEGVGWHLAQRLAAHPHLPAGVDVLAGGTDLLRHGDDCAGRDHVFLLDALLHAERAGTLLRQELPADGYTEAQGSAHHLSALQAVRLLQRFQPGCERTRFTLLAVAIAGAQAGTSLSPALAARLPELEAQALRAIGGP